MEPQPVQTDSGKGGGPQKRMRKEWTVKMEGKKSTVKVKEETPSITLGLGIGATSAQNHVMTQQGKRVVFTAAQLHELQQQTAIFKFIAARLPVPLHLVVPVWKSVASSFGSANGGIYKQYPSFVGFSPGGFGYRNMMDPEPGRCRRTDGKKWRCRKNVVPDQKYCEGHMHRGRQRSRKLVEASQIAPSSATAPKNSNKYSENSKTISTPATFQLMTPSSSTIISHRTSPTSSDNDCIGIKNSVTTFTISATAANTISSTPTTTPTVSTTSTTPTVIAANTITSTLTTPTITTNPTTRNIRTSPTTTTNNNNSDSKTNHNLDGKAVNQSIKNRINMNIPQGVDFSPKSVLQVQGCSGSCFYRSDIELEPGRCRRTDGKKWRCSRDVVPEQKYCTQHMHRGAKKHVEASQPAAVPSAARLPHTKAASNQANYATPNTKLSISIPASPQLMTNDEKSPNSSDSDTTISDTTITAYEIGNFSL